MPDPKKLAMMIIARKKPDDAEESDDASKDDGPSGGEAAAQDMLDAIEAKDAGALASAMKSFMDIASE